MTPAVKDALAYYGLTRPIFLDFEYFAPPGCNPNRSASLGNVQIPVRLGGFGCGMSRNLARFT